MARILFAWELGAGLGHLNRMLQVARVFQKRGHQVFMVVQDLSKVRYVAQPDDNFMWFQAPVWLPPLRDRPAAISYAEILFFTGFLDPAGLMGLVRGWHALFAAIQPDLMVCDHAPVSLLSARSAGFKKVTMGTGFCHPPPLSPLPAFRVWESIDNQRLVSSEGQALETCNRILQAMGQPVLRHLHELFSVDGSLLTSWEAFDHYPNRPISNHRYVGPLTETGGSSSPIWPVAGKKRIFAYLKAEYGGLEQVLDSLARNMDGVLVYLSGATDALVDRYTSPSLAFSSAPLSLDLVLTEADAVICHAGMGTVTSALRAGCPVLTLPLYSEQRITGERVAALGYGLCVTEQKLDDELESALHKLCHDEAMRLRVEQFMREQADDSAAATVETIVRYCEALIGVGEEVS